MFLEYLTGLFCQILTKNKLLPNVLRMWSKPSLLKFKTFGKSISLLSLNTWNITKITRGRRSLILGSAHSFCPCQYDFSHLRKWSLTYWFSILGYGRGFCSYWSNYLGMFVFVDVTWCFRKVVVQNKMQPY